MSFKLLTAQINHIISQDISKQARLDKLNESKIAIELLGISSSFLISINDNKVRITVMQPTDAYAAKISASMLDFMYMMKNKHKAGFVFPPKAKITGDGEQATRVLIFLGDIEVDWERYLAMYIGDVPSHIATKVIKSGVSVFAGLLQNTQQNVADFLTDEADIVPTQSEVEDFCHGVTEAMNDVARLEARLSRLLNNDKGSVCEQ